MKRKPIIISSTSLIILIYLWHYTNSFSSLASKPLIAFAIMFLVVFPIFAYGILLMAKDLNTRLEQNKSKSIFYHLYSLLKILVGIMGIVLGISMAYFDIIHGLTSWFNIVLHILLIYALTSVGIKIFLNTIKAYRGNS